MWQVYIIQCKDDTLYTGITNDLKKRLAAHNAGRGGKFTRSRRPVKLVYSRKALTKSKALQKEAEIKSLSRKEKLKFIL